MSYRVVVSREDGAWLASVPGVRGAHTWARSLAALDRYVREAIALVLDLPDKAEKDLALDLEFSTGDGSVDAALADLRLKRRELAAAERDVTTRTAELAKTLVRKHNISVRDAAKLLGLSPQRVSQLAPQLRPMPSPKRAAAAKTARAVTA